MNVIDDTADTREVAKQQRPVYLHIEVEALGTTPDSELLDLQAKLEKVIRNGLLRQGAPGKPGYRSRFKIVTIAVRNKHRNS